MEREAFVMNGNFEKDLNELIRFISWTYDEVVKTDRN
jgi:hypothetical protein